MTRLVPGAVAARVRLGAGGGRYEGLEDPLAGDAHAVCPKLLAFKGPLRPGHPARGDGEVALPAGYYARLFAGMGVAAVVRLNDADTYDPAAFTDAGMRHHDLQFPDCTVPSSPSPLAGSREMLHLPLQCHLVYPPVHAPL